jgi:thioredoxin-related protein
MKKIVVILLMAVSVSVFASGNNGSLGIGDKAVLTEIKMEDVSGVRVSLNDAKKENGILVLFSCNTCPFVMQWEGRYPDLKAWADKNKVGMVVLNSNHQKHDAEDSLEAMKKHSKEKGYNFYYLLDKESAIANAFGGQTTPHAFLFDSKMDLVYKGAIDDSYKSADEVKQAYLKDAISNLASGKEVTVAETKPVGCSIKRKID